VGGLWSVSLSAYGSVQAGVERENVHLQNVAHTTPTRQPFQGLALMHQAWAKSADTLSRTAPATRAADRPVAMTQLSTRLELTRSRRDANAFEWLEIVLAILVVPMVGALITPNDPFFNQASFPWGALGPLIIALRHGSARGLIAAAALIGLNALAADSTWMQDAVFSREIALGTVLIALIGGIWSDAYAHRLEAEQARIGYQTQRLNDFAQNYHALRISHDRLEYRLAGSVVSLRETLQDVRRAFQRSLYAKQLDPAQQLGNVLVAAPLVDSANTVRALVTVRRIPFLSFTPDNIQLLAVLSAHIGHLISEAEHAGKGDSEQRFRRELKHVCNDARRFHREYNTFQDRLEEAVEQRYGRSLAALGGSISKRPIGPDSDADAIWTSWRSPRG